MRHILWLSGFFVPILAYAQESPSQQTATAQASLGQLWSALIGAAAALVVVVLKDLAIPLWTDYRKKKKSQQEIYRNYSAPLIASCESLIWRFDEILSQKRHQFLKLSSIPKIYNKYKRNSTLYRLAVLLGWLRAMDLELSALPRGGQVSAESVKKAINSFRSALADGIHVEVDRLIKLSAVWGIDINALTDDRRRSISTNLEVKLYQIAGCDLRRDSDRFLSLDDSEKKRICHEVSDYLCKEIGVSAISHGIVDEAINKAISAISYREALIYRDWQNAIGDAMLERDEDSARRFRVISYEKFESALAADNLWMESFQEIVNDVDFENINPNDFRVKQIKDVSKAVSGMILAFYDTEDRDLIDSGVVSASRVLSVME